MSRPTKGEQSKGRAVSHLVSWGAEEVRRQQVGDPSPVCLVQQQHGGRRFVSKAKTRARVWREKYVREARTCGGACGATTRAELGAGPATRASSVVFVSSAALSSSKSMRVHGRPPGCPSATARRPAHRGPPCDSAA